jgi:hypothetical protein
MSKQTRRSKFTLSRIRKKLAAGFATAPTLTADRQKQDTPSGRTRNVPWIFTIDQAGHYVSR